LGSKLRLIEPVRQALDQVDPSRGTLVDLFSGSGTVSAAMSTMRDIVAVDIQEYSRVLCSAVLNPVALSESETLLFLSRIKEALRVNYGGAAPLIEYEQACIDRAQRGEFEPICELIEHASIIKFQATSRPVVQPIFERAMRHSQKLIDVHGPQTLILRFFGGLFYSYSQAAQLDAALTIAHEEMASRRDFLLAAIVSTASELVNTVGKHFAQPIRPRSSNGKPKSHLIAKIVRDRKVDAIALLALWLDRYRSLPIGTRRHTAIRADYAEALTSMQGKIGVVYADPPYTRDHYSRFYHVLETMCLRDNPGVSTTRIRVSTAVMSRGMYRLHRHQSPFCIRSQAAGAFEALFAGVRRLEAPLVLSYSPYASDSNAHPRVMTVDQILPLAKKHFSEVELLSAGRIKHMKLNASRLHIEASAEAELMLLCR
jgi:adenine-specific DNA methylase